MRKNKKYSLLVELAASLSSLSLDDRKGLGYGQLKNTYQSSRIHSDNFPYVDDDPYEEDDEVISDDEIDEFIKKVSSGYSTVDFGAASSTDKNYYVGGNTRGLSGVMEAPMRDSMVPYPNMYKGKVAVSGGFTQQKAYDVSPSRRSGTLRGFSKSPEPVTNLPEDDIGYDKITDILSDDEMAVYKAVINRLVSLGKK
jgi:hypothetical protein